MFTDGVDDCGCDVAAKLCDAVDEPSGAWLGGVGTYARKGDW